MLSVRELQPHDIPSIIRYWTEASPDHLQAMGVDLAKMPDAAAWKAMISAQLTQPYDKKGSYCTIWLQHGEAVGHCNVTNIIPGKEAYMHLHLWESPLRQKGLGAALVRLSLPYFFRNLQLLMLYCAPYALNPAPNKTLERAGFSFGRQYVGTPGSINFEQEVNIWEMSRAAFERLAATEKGPAIREASPLI